MFRQLFEQRENKGMLKSMAKSGEIATERTLSRLHFSQWGGD
jgi:hypothetical protein